MRIITIKSEGIAALSYFVSSEKQGIVIDPRRDASIYYELALQEDVEILYIIETHRNEDYVIGSLELQSMVPDAEIGHSNATQFHYGELSLADGETFKAGQMHITCLSTPGHTDDSMCYTISDKENGSDPIVVFTGDTLFVNEVGRTDLVDMNKHAFMSEKLYDSLHTILLKLDDGVIIHPGHGSGSVCGGSIGEREFSTIGYERKHNPWLKMSEDEFVKAKVKQKLTRAPYFKHCEKLNTDGPPLISSFHDVPEIDVKSLKRLMKQDTHRAVDVRTPLSFIEEHIPGSISLSLSNMGLIAAWSIKPEYSISLIIQEPRQLEEAWSYLVRVGIDNTVGYLRDGLTSWTLKGWKTASIEPMELDELRRCITHKSISLLDVRETHEYEEEHVPNSISVPLTQLGLGAPLLLGKGSIATICPSGFRSTTAASLLKRLGYNDVRVAWSGLNEWTEKGYQLTSSLHL